MLNLFNATGRNNHAKSTRLYLQPVAVLEKHHLEVYQQFLLVNHTVRLTNNNWSDMWTDLSVEQILMKSLEELV